jgi:hypothetical protein
VWLAAALAGQVVVWRARSLDSAGAESWRRTAVRLTSVEHAALVVVLAAGLALMRARGWTATHARWLGVKLGLVVFLVIPLEAMHAYVNHVWLTRAASASRERERGLALDEMLRTLALVLLGPAVPFLIWLSVAKPWSR